jgi:hypothetical protein
LLLLDIVVKIIKVATRVPFVVEITPIIIVEL